MFLTGLLFQFLIGHNHIKYVYLQTLCTEAESLSFRVYTYDTLPEKCFSMETRE